MKEYEKQIDVKAGALINEFMPRFITNRKLQIL